MKKTVIMLFVLICLALGVQANAQEPQKTTVTLNTSLQVPGREALPAGRYVFKRLQLTSGHPIVQIFNGDETQLLDTVIGIPDNLEKPPENSMIALYETEPGNPPALMALLFHGDPVAIEFVYPTEQATTLARQSGQNVMAAQNAASPNPSEQPTPEQLEAMKKEVVSVITPDGQTISIVEARKSTKGESSNDH
jgi:hypothetical protein